MAKPKDNDNGRLQESLIALSQSMALLNQSTVNLNQSMTAFQANHIALIARMAESDRVIAAKFAEIDERFNRIEAILIEHTRILQALPDAVREKIGFRMPEQQK